MARKNHHLIEGYLEFYLLLDAGVQFRMRQGLFGGGSLGLNFFSNGTFAIDWSAVKTGLFIGWKFGANEN